MFRNFITLAYRHFVRSPLTSFIEVFGLTAAFTVSILILLWVAHELNYDKFNEHYDQIYRLETATIKSVRRPLVAHPYEKALEKNIPEIVKADIVTPRYVDYRLQVVDDQSAVRRDDYVLERVMYAGQEFFEVFSMEFVKGDKEGALAQKNQIVLTENTAELIFGDEDPMGRTLRNPWGTLLTITGVIKDEPQFHIRFAALCSSPTMEDHLGKDFQSDWNDVYHPLYLRLHSSADPKVVERKITEVLVNQIPKEIQERWGKETAFLRPLSDIYFNGDEVNEMGYSLHGDSKRLIAYIFVVFFTLLLACVNFINLSSSKSIERAKEIGLKKLTGASRLNIFLQFFGEAFLLCLLAMILSLIFSHTMAPLFNGLMGSSIAISNLLETYLILGLIAILFGTSFLAGGIPSFYISSIAPVEAIKGLTRKTSSGLNFRKTSLLLQFSLTIVTLISLVTIFQQLDFMKGADLGYSKDQLVSFSGGPKLRGESKYDVLKERLLKNSNIISITKGLDIVPGFNNVAGKATATFVMDETSHQMKGVFTDPDYLATLDLKMIDGRFFEYERPSDEMTKNQVISNIVINETALKQLGLKEPIGTLLKWPNMERSARIIGVMEDFHINSLKEPIEPTRFQWFQIPPAQQVLLKIRATNKQETIESISEEVLNITNQKPDVRFVEDGLAQQFGDEDNFAELLTYLTIVVILIGSMGLLGIFMHLVKIRLKEIGVRKVMGASVPQIILLLTGSFVKTILISSLIAIPIGAILMNSWLDNYPYRIEMNSMIFVLAVGFTLLAAMLTIGWGSWQASNTNPARLIRYE